MSIHLFAAGSNYTGESFSLPDCETDVINVVEAFEPYCAKVKCLIGEQSTRPKTITALRSFLDPLEAGDLALVYFSGHGTTDTIDGKSVQAIVHHGGTLSYEYEIRRHLRKRAAGVMGVYLADCCFSGGLARGTKGKARTINISHCFKHETERPTRDVKRPNATYAACRAGQVAFSTGQGGAMTLAFLEAFEQRTIKTTLPALHKAVQKLLPSAQWNQHPCFYADATMKKRTLASFREAA